MRVSSTVAVSLSQGENRATIVLTTRGLIFTVFYAGVQALMMFAEMFTKPTEPPIAIVDKYEWYGYEPIESWIEQAAPRLRKLGVVLVVIYIAALWLVAVFRVWTRKSRDSAKPLFTCMLDTLLEIPHLLKVGPWGKENTIMEALASAMDETKLTDFGFDNDAGDSETWKTINTPGAKRSGVGGKDYSASDPYGFVERYEKSRTEGLAKIKGRYSPTGHLLAFRTIHRRMVTRLKHVEYVY